jgi:hypothetical protein
MAELSQEGRDWMERLRREVTDATLLLDFAIAHGKQVDEQLIGAIRAAEEAIAQSQIPSADQRATFDQAYRDLAQFLRPVNVTTLRATSDEHGRKAGFLLTPHGKKSESKIWSRKLWMWTVAAAVFIVISENYSAWLNRFSALDEFSDAVALRRHTIAMILQSIVPFAYGGLGALAYLLRSAHTHLCERSFDPLRVPEYYNRMLLGLVAGGAIQLFITQVAGEGTMVRLSASALAFISGYNCDFLFTTIERVSAAILPKVGIESVRRAEIPLAGVSMETLMRQYETASPEGKKVIEGLINKLKERL